ncbi:MAG: RusA family crossover junction endodeoxyribonuclease [Janthinobacterium lividum]
MMIEFIAKVVPEPQGSVKSFVMPNREEIERVARNLSQGWMNLPQIIAAITEAAKKSRAILTSDNNDLKAYRMAVAYSAKRVLGGQSELFAPKHVPVGMRLEFVFERPPSVTKKRLFPVVKPDLDKLERAVLDSLTQIVYLDDSQVVELTASKVYGPKAQVTVQVWTIDESTTGKLF